MVILYHELVYCSALVYVLCGDALARKVQDSVMSWGEAAKVYFRIMC
jgi:hypothetical protein